MANGRNGDDLVIENKVNNAAIQTKTIGTMHCAERHRSGIGNYEKQANHVISMKLQRSLITSMNVQKMKMKGTNSGSRLT